MIRDEIAAFKKLEELETRVQALEAASTEETALDGGTDAEDSGQQQ